MILLIRGDKYFVDGTAVSEEEFFSHRVTTPGRLLPIKQAPPHASDAMAVHCEQVPEAIEDAKKRGVPTEYLKDGRPVFRSRAHQKAFLRAYKKHNNDGGYGD